MNPRLTTITSLIMAVLCWLGMGYLMFAFPPDAVARLLFLCLLFLAVTFTLAPLFLAVHNRVARTAGAEVRLQGAAWREAGLTGLFLSLCAWLRFIRVLNWVNGLLLVVVLTLTEILLLARER